MAPGDGAAGPAEAVVVLDSLVVDLTAVGVGESELAELVSICGGVQQASLHAAEGDTEAAIAAIEFARRVYIDSGLAVDGCLG